MSQTQLFLVNSYIKQTYIFVKSGGPCFQNYIKLFIMNYIKVFLCQLQQCFKLLINVIPMNVTESHCYKTKIGYLLRY